MRFPYDDMFGSKDEVRPWISLPCCNGVGVVIVIVVAVRCLVQLLLQVNSKFYIKLPVFNKKLLFRSEYIFGVKDKILLY